MWVGSGGALSLAQVLQALIQPLARRAQEGKMNVNYCSKAWQALSMCQCLCLCLYVCVSVCVYPCPVSVSCVLCPVSMSRSSGRVSPLSAGPESRIPRYWRIWTTTPRHNHQYCIVIINFITTYVIITFVALQKDQRSLMGLCFCWLWSYYQLSLVTSTSAWHWHLHSWQNKLWSRDVDSPRNFCNVISCQSSSFLPW